MSARKVPKLLIVGAGITGATASAALRSAIPASELSISIWDKARGAGGRMTTSRAKKDEQMHLDLGAQCITAGAGGGNVFAHHSKFSYEALNSVGLLREMSGKVENSRFNHEEKVHYIAPRGMSSLVQYFLGDSKVHFNRRALSINKVANGWEVTDTENLSDTFDAIVMTIPSAQILELEGGIHSVLTSQSNSVGEKLKQVQYSSRWALGLYYPYNAWPALDDAGWSARYVTRLEDDALVWLSLESKRRGFAKPAETDGPGPVIVAHAGVPWSIEHFDDTPACILEDLMPRIHKFIPALSAISPSETKLIRWKYSQVTPGTNVGGSSLDHAAIRIGVDEAGLPPLVLAGDSIAGSNYENCIRSGWQAAELVKETLGFLSGTGSSSSARM